MSTAIGYDHRQHSRIMLSRILQKVNYYSSKKENTNKTHFYLSKWIIIVIEFHEISHGLTGDAMSCKADICLYLTLLNHVLLRPDIYGFKQILGQIICH